MNDLNVVFVNFKMKDDLMRALPSVLADAQASGFSIGIVVADNSDNSDGIREAISTHFPTVTYLNSGGNVGFGLGNTKGFKRSPARYYMALNCDTFIAPGSNVFGRIITYLDEHPNVGAVGPKLLNIDGTSQDSCYRFDFASIIVKPLKHFPKLMKFDWVKRQNDRLLMRDFDHNSTRPVDWILGAALAVRREAIGRVGWFDERYFMYLEDCDWCHAIWKSGYEVHYLHDAVVSHVHARGSAKVPGIKAVFMNRLARIHISSWIKYLWKWRGEHRGHATDNVQTSLTQPTPRQIQSMQKPKVAIIYLSFHSEPYWEDILMALKKLTYPRESVEFVVVDNPHPKFGASVPFINEHVMPLSGNEIPHVTVLAQTANLGFAGGNNKGIEWALEHGFDYVYFHNNDGYMAASSLEPLVETMEADKTIGATQSLMLLHPETDLINSAGNTFHYLGFGYCLEYRTPLAKLEMPLVKDVAYASGAAVMMRADLLKQYGLWDHDFFLYHEDLEYSFRLRAAGFRICCVRDSIFYHKYEFSRSIQKYFWMERNRYGVLLEFFKLPTLLLLLPIMIPLELGLIAFSIKGGWWRERFKAYAYWLKVSSWKLWLGKRKNIFAMRTISDRDFMSIASSEILFQEASMQNPILKYIGNPIMKLYYTIIVRGLIWW